MRLREAWSILVLTAFVAVTSPAGSFAQEAGDAAGRLQLRVGVSPDYPPLAFREGGQLSGIEIDFAKRLQADFDVDVTFVEMKFADLIDALNDNDDLVRSSADMALKGITLHEEPFAASLGRQELRRLQTAWRKWWKENEAATRELI